MEALGGSWRSWAVWATYPRSPAQLTTHAADLPPDVRLSTLAELGPLPRSPPIPAGRQAGYEPV